MVLKKMLEGTLDCKETKPGNPKGKQSWIFIGRTAAEAEAPILWPPDVKNWLIWKDPDAGKDRWQAEKGMTEDKRVRWHHRLYGHEYEQAPGDGGEQGSLECCTPWGYKESDATEQQQNCSTYTDKHLTVCGKWNRKLNLSSWTWESFGSMRKKAMRAFFFFFSLIEI